MVKDVAGAGLDFVPIVGDIKGFVEAQTALDYLAAAIGVIVYIWYSLVHEVLRSAPEQLCLLKEICQKVDEHLVWDGEFRSFWLRTKDSVPL